MQALSNGFRQLKRAETKVNDYFHAIGGMIKRYPTEKQLKILKKGSDSVAIAILKSKGFYCRRRDQHYLNIVTPTLSALNVMKALGFSPNRVEVARDYCVDDADSTKDNFDKHFVQSWHRTRKTIQYKATTYTGQRRHRLIYVWYVRQEAFHLEARLRGKDRLRVLKIETVEDLAGFDFDNFWEGRLVFREVNIEALSEYFGDERKARIFVQTHYGKVQDMIDALKLSTRRRNRIFPLTDCLDDKP